MSSDSKLRKGLAWALLLAVMSLLAGPSARAGTRPRRSRGSIQSTIECTTAPPAASNVLLDCPADSAYPTDEPAIVVDPTNSLHMVAGAKDETAGVAGIAEFYTTFDGGVTWTEGDVSLQDSQRIAADPSISFDARHGTVIYAYQDAELTQTGQFCDLDQVAAVSTDEGLHWGAPVEVAGGSGCFGGPVTGYDKDWVVTDNHPGSPHYGRTYLVTSAVTCTTGDCDASLGHGTWQVSESHSDDGGSSWTPLSSIAGSSPSYCTDPHGPACDLSDGSWPTVSPDGSVHVAFENFQHGAAWEPGECCEAQFLVVNSADGGATWSDPVHVADLEDGTRDYSNCSAAFGVFPDCTLTGTQLTVRSFSNVVASPRDGTLYLVFDDNRNGTHDSDQPVTNLDVFVMTSTDGGSTWAGPDVVTDAPGDQWFPFADVNPLTGALAVIYNSRASATAQTFDVVLATGLPGSFTATTITSASSHLDHNLWFPAGVPGCEKCASYAGDYINLAYGPDGTANLVWTDLRRRVTVPKVGNGYTQNIFYAKA